MADPISIEHATFGVLGPIAHTPTRAMSVHCVIFRIGERVILLDSGFGTREMRDPNRLLGDDALWRLAPLIDPRLTAHERLKAQGIRPEQVTDIILTYLDNDHAGGVHDFPEATVHLSREELESYDGMQPRGPYKPYQVSHRTKFKTYERTGERWFDLEARSLQLPGALEAKLVPLPGHTHGHCGVAYREEGRWCLHAGNAYFDGKINFLEHAPGLHIEIAFQTSAEDGGRACKNCGRCERNTARRSRSIPLTISRNLPTGPTAEGNRTRSVATSSPVDGANSFTRSLQNSTKHLSPLGAAPKGKL